MGSFWKQVLVFLGIVLLCFFIGNLVLVGLAMAGGLKIEAGLDIIGAMASPGIKPFIQAGIGMNHLIIFTGSALLFAFWVKRKNWKDYFDWANVEFGLLSLFVLLLFCAYPIILASAALLEGVDLPSWMSQIDEESIESLMKMLDMDGPVDLLINLVIVGLLPAIGEELMFRGIIQNELVKKMNNPHVAILIACVIFSGMHLQIQGFFPKFFIGLVLGYSYYWTKSLWYPMILHFINNALPIFSLYLVGDSKEALENESLEPETSHILIGIVISCFLCYFIVTSIRKQIEASKTA